MHLYGHPQCPEPKDSLQRFVTWVVWKALPCWTNSPPGSLLPIAERYDWRGQPDTTGFLRLRVIARQVSVFAGAVTMGCEWAHPHAERGWDALERYFWEEDNGWHACVGEDGNVRDREFGLYDQAFAIYACAAWSVASGETAPVARAMAALELIEKKLRADGRPGWRSNQGVRGFDQNSHMHFFEALLALYDCRPSSAIRSRITEILNLLETHLIAPVPYAVVEEFDADWNSKVQSIRIEPGHQYEWSWLLAQARVRGFESSVIPDRLENFAARHGWCEQNGLIVDACRHDGTWLSAHHRLWPHCEALRAATVSDNAFGGRAAAEAIAKSMLDCFLQRPFAAGWIDRLSPEMEPTVCHVPASSLYHLWEAARAVCVRGWATLDVQSSC